MESDTNLNRLIECVEEISELSTQTSYRVIHKEVMRYEERLKSAKNLFTKIEVFQNFSQFPEIDFIKTIGERCEDKIQVMSDYCENMDNLVFSGDVDLQYLKHSIAELGLLHANACKKLNGIKQEYIRSTTDKLLKNH